MSYSGSWAGRRDRLEVMIARAIAASRSGWSGLCEMRAQITRHRLAAVRWPHYRRVVEAVLTWGVTTGGYVTPPPTWTGGWPRARARSPENL